MKYRILLFLTVLVVSCSKSKDKSQPENVDVMVYATVPNDTAIVASTGVIQLQVR